MKEINKEDQLINDIVKEQNPYSKQCPNRHLWDEGFKTGYKYANGANDFADAVLKRERPTNEHIINVLKQYGITNHVVILFTQGKTVQNIANDILTRV